MTTVERGLANLENVTTLHELTETVTINLILMVFILLSPF